MSRQREGTNVVDMIDPPPARFAISREAWAKTPEIVRAEILRAHSELTRGIEKYKPAAARDAELTDFHEMAKAAGTTLEEALLRYIGLENTIRHDPERGIVAMCHHIGIDPIDLATELLRQPDDAA